MGTASPRRVRAEIMSSRLADFSGIGTVLIATCARCRDHREIRVDALVGDYGALRVRDVIGRLRCQTCHEPPCGVALRAARGETVLLGLGAGD